MRFETIKVEKMAVALGAEISGIDVSKQLGNQTFQEVHDALVENQVIFFRNQDITPDQPKESRAVLEFLYRHIETPEFHVRFKWRVNSIAFWDNRSTQHRAIADYFPQTRSMQRVTINADAAPFYRPN